MLALARNAFFRRSIAPKGGLFPLWRNPILRPLALGLILAPIMIWSAGRWWWDVNEFWWTSRLGQIWFVCLALYAMAAGAQRLNARRAIVALRDSLPAEERAADEPATIAMGLVAPHALGERIGFVVAALIVAFGAGWGHAPTLLLLAVFVGLARLIRGVSLSGPQLADWLEPRRGLLDVWWRMAAKLAALGFAAWGIAIFFRDGVDLARVGDRLRDWFGLSQGQAVLASFAIVLLVFDPLYRLTYRLLRARFNRKHGSAEELVRRFWVGRGERSTDKHG